MSGVIPSNAGAIEINGRALTHASPALAQKLGLYLVPQEAHILPNQSVLENICLGLAASPRALRPRVEQLVAELSVSLDLDVQAAALEIAERQIVEILRGLVRDARVLILDEPTSALTPFETSALFQRVRKLQSQGVGIFFISHKLREIREICGTISVLRDGVIVLSGPLDSYSDAEIIDAMSRVQIADDADRIVWAARFRRSASRVSACATSAAKGSAISASTCGPAKSSALPGSWAPDARSSPKRSSAFGRRWGQRRL